MKKMTLLKLVNLIFLTVLFTHILIGVSGYNLANEATILQDNVDGELGMRYLSMMLATGLSSIAAAYAVSETGKAAIASITEKPELFGSTVIYVGLAEGIAIY
ncbi:MAG: H+transporting two-sector ATPase C subunit, partial [Candidatus Korarchaeota archaeon]|nr:H+transporting two-sector ATPase C subunit [Candidatus Korarchaeota archaeon]NIU84228.1 H+transporting two-sector ATPase C subunit [Candidatus Thorarchaeota archaeon]NIW13590.1 H+transporting two-sector ATPase C subunit [Candidatus Thorarchaeota archaeon]NIW51407.1 H+transporting two-sector ATPase C subunit [Candidatus Korarchaeota archaeon]